MTLTRKTRKNKKLTKISNTDPDKENTIPSLFRNGTIIAINGDVKIETLKIAIIYTKTK